MSNTLLPVETAMDTNLTTDPRSRITATTNLFMERLQNKYYDFIDLGTCDGGGFQIAALLGGKQGLGFDLEPGAVVRSLDKNLDVAQYDICTLRAGSASVDFAVCSHILEHLPSTYDVGCVLKSLSSICRDYIIITGPYFDEEAYLYNHNVKVLHSAMPDHTCKFTVFELMKILYDLGLRDYVIALGQRILDTSNIWVHSADEPYPPDGLWTYDKEKHKPKPNIVFDREIYRDFVSVVSLRAGVDTDGILKKFLWGYDKIIHRSAWKF